MSHRYQIVVQPLDKNEAPVDGETFSFAAESHDDLHAVLSKVRMLDAVPISESAEFVVGLKLLAGVLLRHRQEPLFMEFWPHFGAFMKRLKGLTPAIAN